GQLFALETGFGRKGNADAGAGDDLLVADLYRHGDRRQQPGCQMFCDPYAVDAGQHHRKFVAPHTCHRVDLAYGAPQPCGGFDDQFVAGPVPQGVVDVLEAIDVDVEQPEHAAASADLRQAAIEPVLEKGTIGQTGERIVEGKEARMSFTALQRGRGLIEPPDERGHGQRAEQQAADGQRRQPHQELLAGLYRLPGKISECFSLRCRYGNLGQAVLWPLCDITDVPQLIALADRRRDWPVEEDDGDVDELCPGPLLDLGGVGNDRAQTDGGRP